MLAPKTKILKLDPQQIVYISPIKATHVCFINEQIQKQKKGLVTAVLARPFYEGRYGLSSRRRHIVQLWRVLFDSGSDADLLFVKAGSNSVPYDVRMIPQAWHTSMGVFSTTKQADLDLVFPEYSHNKRFHVRPDIVEYDDKNNRPYFDMIIGTETLEKCKVLLDFDRKVIAINQIELPMRNISNLQAPNV